MSCIAPQEIRAGDLLAYVEGTAGPRVREHIARCASCADEVKTLARLDYILSTTPYREACPATTVLVQYQSGLLPARQRRQVERHLQMCPLCTSEVERIAALDEPHASRSLWEEMRQAIHAVLEAVQWQPTPQAALVMRGGLVGPTLYQAGEWFVALGCEAPEQPDGLWVLRGRVTRGGLPAAELTGAPVWLVQAGRVISRRTVEELGYFVFDYLTAGIYDVWIEPPRLANRDQTEKDIVVRQVTIGAPGEHERDPTP